MSLRNDGYSASAISKARGFLFQAFRSAVANEIVPKNVVAYAAKMRCEKHAPKEIFTDDEIKKLMSDLPLNRIGLSIRLAILCGFRKQEILALTRDDIAPDGSMITIKRAVSRKKGSAYISSTKTAASNRVVYVPERARKYAVLLRESAETLLVWESSKKPGSPVNPSTYDNYYYSALVAVGVRRLSSHCCRHTAASILLAAGNSREVISATLGHVEIDTTDQYLHVRDNDKIEAMNSLNVFCPE